MLSSMATRNAMQGNPQLGTRIAWVAASRSASVMTCLPRCSLWETRNRGAEAWLIGATAFVHGRHRRPGGGEMVPAEDEPDWCSQGREAGWRIEIRRSFGRHQRGRPGP